MPGTDRAIQVFTQRAVVLSYPGYRVAHRACDGTSGALWGGAGTSVPTSESDGSGQLAQQDLAFDLRLRRTSRVSTRVRVREVLIDLGQPPPICRLGPSVQQLASIAVGGRCGWAGVVRCSLERDEIQDMEFASGLGEQS